MTYNEVCLGQRQASESPLLNKRSVDIRRRTSLSSAILLVGCTVIVAASSVPLLTYTLCLKGAAIALLDAVYLPLHFPSDVTVRYVGYTSPRVSLVPTPQRESATMLQLIE